MTSHSWVQSLESHFFCHQVQNPPASSSSSFSTPGALAGWPFAAKLSPQAVGLWMGFSSGALQHHPFASAAFGLLNQFEAGALTSNEHAGAHPYRGLGMLL